MQQTKKSVVKLNLKCSKLNKDRKEKRINRRRKEWVEGRKTG